MPRQSLHAQSGGANNNSTGHGAGQNSSLSSPNPPSRSSRRGNHSFGSQTNVDALLRLAAERIAAQDAQAREQEARIEDLMERRMCSPCSAVYASC